jgi:hypothetical protein
VPDLNYKEMAETEISKTQGFQPELYEIKFKSKGDSTLSKRVVELYKEASNLHTRSPDFYSPIFMIEWTTRSFKPENGEARIRWTGFRRYVREYR